MTQVVTARDGVYVRSGHSATHKQGKLPKDVFLNVIGETSKALELDPAHTKAVIEHYDPNRDSDYDMYPAFWIQKADVLDAPGPSPYPDSTPQPTPEFSQAGAAFTYLMVWIRELWR